MPKSKKSVLLYMHQSILRGGVEKVFHTILHNLPPDRYDVTVMDVMGYLDDDFRSPLYPTGVKRICLQWDQYDRRLLPRLWQKVQNRINPLLVNVLLKFKRYDIAIAAQEGPYAKFVADKVRAHRRLLWIHNDMGICHWSKKHFDSLDAERRCYATFDGIACVSEGVRASMAALFGTLPGLQTVYNPIDTPYIDKCLEGCAETPARGTTEFVCLGRLAHQKGYDRLLEAVHLLNLKGYNFHVTILGEGEDRPMLERTIHDYGLNNVTLAGNRPNPFPYVKAANWFLQPSRHEGFSLALHEATYCGTPSITTDVAGARELLGDNHYGIITANSTLGICDALRKVLDNPALEPHYRTLLADLRPRLSLASRLADIRRFIDGPG